MYPCQLCIFFYVAYKIFHWFMLNPGSILAPKIYGCIKCVSSLKSDILGGQKGCKD